MISVWGRIATIFKAHGETAIKDDCFGFLRNLRTPECRGCSMKGKCGEIRADIKRHGIAIPEQSWVRDTPRQKHDSPR